MVATIRIQTSPTTRPVRLALRSLRESSRVYSVCDMLRSSVSAGPGAGPVGPSAHKLSGAGRRRKATALALRLLQQHRRAVVQHLRRPVADLRRVVADADH